MAKIFNATLLMCLLMLVLIGLAGLYEAPRKNKANKELAKATQALADETRENTDALLKLLKSCGRIPL